MQSEKVDQVGYTHQGMPPFQGVPFIRKGMFIVVPGALFGQETLFNPPPVTGRPVTAVDYVFLGYGGARHPRPGSLVSCPGFVANHHLKHQAMVVVLGIPPNVNNVVSPPKVLGPVAPLMPPALFRFQLVDSESIFPDRRKAVRRQNDHEVPAVLPADLHHWAVGIKPVGHNEQRKLTH